MHLKMLEIMQIWDFLLNLNEASSFEVGLNLLSLSLFCLVVLRSGIAESSITLIRAIAELLDISQNILD